MSLQVVPDVEAVIGDYLRGHADIQALDARIAGRTPSSQRLPWVRVTQLDGTDVSGVEHLIDFLVQFDCYAGKDAMDDHVGQAEASLLARTVRAVLKAAKGHTLGGAVITNVRFQGMPRIPDPDFEPARERFVLTAEIHLHAA
jgi:hypothetical protein